MREVTTMYYALCIIIYIYALLLVYRLHKNVSWRPPSDRHRLIETFVKKLDRLTEKNYALRSDKPQAVPNSSSLTLLITLLARLFLGLVSPILPLLFHHEIQSAIFRPENAFAYSSNEIATVLFAVGAFTNVEVRRTPITQTQMETIERAKQDWIKEPTIDLLCVCS